MDISRKITDFFSHYPMVGFAKGEVLIQADTKPSAIFYIVTGQVRQYDVAPSGDQVVVNIFQPPAFFPMNIAINKTPNPYIFEAFTQVAARKAPAADVVRFVKEHPDVLFDLLSRVYSGTDGLQRRMVYLMEHDAQKRLLMELLISADRFGEPRADGGIFVSLHEGELAARAGLARETVNRLLRTLKTEGLLTITSQGIEIISLAALRQSLG